MRLVAQANKCGRAADACGSDGSLVRRGLACVLSPESDPAPAIDCFRPCVHRDRSTAWSKGSVRLKAVRSRPIWQKTDAAIVQDVTQPMQGRHCDQRRSVKSTIHKSAEKQSPSTIAAGTPSCVLALKRGEVPSDKGRHGAVIPDLISNILGFYLGDTLTRSSLQTFICSSVEWSRSDERPAVCRQGRMRCAHASEVGGGECPQRHGTLAVPCRQERLYRAPASRSLVEPSRDAGHLRHGRPVPMRRNDKPHFRCGMPVLRQSILVLPASVAGEMVLGSQRPFLAVSPS
ncbi:hypothetical protein HNO88_000723 [Novosphingobium chloroacetimidivorans]|uniref:Uncharacterized protein n=1 Tax=Novosphingobium chloroacetimidivorans TaxID=1428314 RepID=A0A7W7K7P8_9SPHN|nr:hypothetical protein [Novosphingobium chloroacetimidivorans]